MADIILVDQNDQVVGRAEKLAAHQNGGQWHRALSIFIFNSRGEFMLQRRALTKYHSGGLWSNSCCSHPAWGEEMEAAVHRRLQEEMGFDCPLQEIFVFPYEAEVGNGLTEKEVDHVWVGFYDGEASPDPAEASDWRWQKVEELRVDMQANPGQYTFWFKKIFDRVVEESKKK
jgi:isopentenyl-diphosphate Delta-isomerase